MATLTLLDEGAARVLPPDSMTLRLFTNDLYLTHYSDFADFTFDNTYNKTLTQGNWTANVTSTYIGFTHTSQVFNFTGSATYYGFAYVLDSGYVYFAAKFDTPWTVTNGTQKYITPFIQVSNYTPIASNSISQVLSRGSLLETGRTITGIKTQATPPNNTNQVLVLGDLLLSGRTPDNIKTLGAQPVSKYSGIISATGLFIGRTIGNLKSTYSPSNIIQGMPLGAQLWAIGSELGNVKALAITNAFIQGISRGSVLTIGRTPDNIKTLASSGTSVSDNFNRSNGSLGDNWTTIPNLNAMVVQSNTATSGSTLCGAYWSANTFSNNQYSEAVVTPSTSAATMNGPCVRVSTSQTTGYFAYLYEYSEDGLRYWQLWKFVNSTGTQLGSEVQVDDTCVRLEANGTSIVLKSASSHGGSFTARISVTDSSISSGYAGITASTGGDNIDNWYGGDL